MLFTLFVPFVVHGASIPIISLYTGPEPVKAGGLLTITALVYNSEKTATTFTVDFSVDNAVIAEKKVSVATVTAKPVTVSWKATSGAHIIDAVITKEVAADGVQIILSKNPSVEVTVTESGSSTDTSATNSLPNQIEQQATGIFARIDAWRVQELGTFEARRDELKQITSDTSKATNTINSITEPDKAGVPDSSMAEKSFWATGATPMQYIQYFFFIILVVIFASALFFYVVAGLLLFLIFRFFWRRFV